MSKSSQLLHISICEHVNKLKMQHVWLCLAFVVLWMLNLHFHSNQNVPLPNFSGYIKKLDDEEHGRFMMSRNTSKNFTDIWDHFSGYWNSTMAFSRFSQSGNTYLPCLALPSKSPCGILISRMILKSPHQLVKKQRQMVLWFDFLSFQTLVVFSDAIDIPWEGPHTNTACIINRLIWYSRSKTRATMWPKVGVAQTSDFL